MFNIIEQQVKLNMKTETREERTPNTPMVADCMCKVSSFLWTAQHSPPLLQWARHKVELVVRWCSYDGRLLERMGSCCLGWKTSWNCVETCGQGWKWCWKNECCRQEWFKNSLLSSFQRHGTRMESYFLDG